MKTLLTDARSSQRTVQRSWRRALLALWLVSWSLLAICAACTTIAATAMAQVPGPGSSASIVNPTRPTVSNSSGIQDKGVLQLETGYDAYPQRVPGDQQTLSTALFYTPFDRLRLDFSWTPYSHQQAGDQGTDGVGTVQMGGKVLMRREEYHRPAPGVAIQYEAELPTASVHELQNLGQQAILLLNHHYGPNGDLDVIVNGSIVQSNCRTAAGCSYGGQQAAAISYHVDKQSRLYLEVFGQNVGQSNTPPGTYLFAGFFHLFSSSFGLDGGMRFGLSDHAASIGTTVGLVFGRRLHGGG